tara:strand:+ start:7452 stop:8057 length:606 start_codon:yes stop_codon:yes gene_type:complete
MKKSALIIIGLIFSMSLFSQGIINHKGNRTKLKNLTKEQQERDITFSFSDLFHSNLMTDIRDKEDGTVYLQKFIDNKTKDTVTYVSGSTLFNFNVSDSIIKITQESKGSNLKLEFKYSGFSQERISYTSKGILGTEQFYTIYNSSTEGVEKIIEKVFYDYEPDGVTVWVTHTILYENGKTLQFNKEYTEKDAKEDLISLDD